MNIAGFTVSTLPQNSVIQKFLSCICEVVIASKATQQWGNRSISRA